MKQTRAEKRQKRREERERKQRERLESHVAQCPHCGKNVLDHMTVCPYCKGQLFPAGYRPVDPARYRKIKLACTILGIAAAIAVVVVILVTR